MSTAFQSPRAFKHSYIPEERYFDLIRYLTTILTEEQLNALPEPHITVWRTLMSIKLGSIDENPTEDDNIVFSRVVAGRLNP